MDLILKVGFGLLNRADGFALFFPVGIMPPHFLVLVLKEILRALVDPGKKRGTALRNNEIVKGGGFGFALDATYALHVELQQVLPNHRGDDYDSRGVGQQHTVMNVKLPRALREFASGKDCVLSLCRELVGPEF